MAKLQLSRFLGQVDEHFQCPVCRHVVNPPKECEECQILICAGCLPDLSTCPGGDHPIVTHDISRFPKKVYESLQLRCGNAESGCLLTGSISIVLAHEQCCDFTRLKCASPVCSGTFIKKDVTIREGTPLVCSEVCLRVWQFGEFMGQKTEVELLKELHTCIMSTKLQVEEEVKKSLQPAVEELKVLQRENLEFEALKGGILQEVEERRHKHHKGKWNAASKQWTCCNSGELLSIGCKEL